MSRPRGSANAPPLAHDLPGFDDLLRTLLGVRQHGLGQPVRFELVRVMALQLPAVGGGTQMATIATLSSVFDAPPEVAASCGILLWLVTFAAVVPLGLLLAHNERLSLRKLSAESHQAEKEMEQPPPRGT